MQYDYDKSASGAIWFAFTLDSVRRLVFGVITGEGLLLLIVMLI